MGSPEGTQAPNNLAAYIWSLADLLRGDFKQSQYGRIILPFTLLRRLECVLEGSKDKVLAEYNAVKKEISRVSRRHFNETSFDGYVQIARTIS